MESRIAILTLIRDLFESQGRAAAIARARLAVECGQIDRLDVADLFIALKTGSWYFLDQLCPRSIRAVEQTAAA